MEIEIHNWHNHPVDVPCSLSKRDVSVQTTEKLKDLFKSGYSAAEALSLLKFDAQLSMSDSDYTKACADRSIIPDLNYVDR